ncbi:helix-turn-helix domain-containing protein [Massiliimalia massiliensis]|uniref:helix-turn-helix domain-containing protein n=1 Tax=Massiliimalia massiliensis TaxID=1852384 RepID=UPI000987A837
MISYKPLWNTLENRGITSRQLITIYGMSESTVSRLCHNRRTTTKTLNRLCEYLACDISNVIEYIPDQNEKS